MAEAVPAAGAPRVSRLDRRKARTRQALIDAAVRLIAEGRGDRASIQEITEEADIGFGSFYNHFDSKEQLFATASEEVLERWGQLIDRASVGITDPRSCSPSARGSPGGWAGPTRRSPGSSPASAWTSWTSPSAWRRVACATSRPGRPRAASLFPMPRSRSAPRPAACSGCFRMRQRHPERVTETTVDQLAEADLRMLGVPADEATRLAVLPLPDTGPW